MRFKFNNDLFLVEMEVIPNATEYLIEEIHFAYAKQEATTVCHVSVDGYPAGTVLVLAKSDMDRERIIDSLGMMPLVIEKERYTMVEEFEKG